MSDDLRFRFKPNQKQQSTPKREPQPELNSGSIFGIWDEQRRLQAEDEKIAKELAEAKKKAKELQRTLRKNRYGDLNQQANTFTRKFIEDTKDFSSKYSSKLFSIIRNYKKISYGIVGVFAIFLSVMVFNNILKSNDNTGTLGDSTATLPVVEDLPREKPSFSILYPEGNSPSDYDVVRISPPDANASYTYLDRFTDDGQIFKVTQQEVPENFDLAKTATDFQATSIIQVDDNIIYHGYSEQGGIQSIIFIKGKKLISIRSPQKFSDDQWANYFLSLN